MKKQLLAVIIASVFVLSACEDKNLASQVFEAEKQITQLGSDLKLSQDQLNKAQDELRKLTAENDRLQQKLNTMGDFPALQVKIVPVFSQTKTLKFEKKPTDDPDLFRESSEIGVFASTAVTGVEWLDQLLLNKLVGEDEQIAKPKNLTFEQAKAQFASQFEGMEQEITAEEVKPIGLNSSSEMSYLGQRNNIVMFSQLNSSYTGGAHGMFYTSYYNIDVNKKAVLGVEDLFHKEKLTELKNILWENYLQHHNEGKAEGAWLSKADFRISDEFYFTPTGGITFVYPPYELGPFVAGEVEISAGFWAIQELMKPEYRPSAERDGIGLNPIEN